MANVTPIPTESCKVGFIGAGKMAESIARGVVSSGVLPASQVQTAHLGARRSVFESFGERQVVQDSDVVIFSAKPQVVKDVVMQLRPLLSEKQLLVSVVAGVKLKDLLEWEDHSRFVRVVPNTPAAVGVAASGIALYYASGPAYVFLAIEALADGGVAAGLPRELSFGLASQTVLGAASMATSTGKHPGQLKDGVASPGGTTIAGIHELEKAGFRGILMNAVVTAAKRSQELSKN
ncbi:hypothetical protein SASPL_143468 [Salvia splendens]|uniref:Pyrroline-5-carboxylate reductase n=1 Tax=Salvia splendens TaxID=180675 RepID=A0A8X8Z9S6_SALSN|nr:hypothetical protein SASPL_143468 [Salvia splendens]